MAIKDHQELLNCIDEYEESPLTRVNNMQVLRMKALKLGEVNDEEHKIVNAIVGSDMALMRLGIEDKKATADSEIALILAEQMAKNPFVKNRTIGTGTQPDILDVHLIEGIVISDESMLADDFVDIDKLGIDD